MKKLPQWIPFFDVKILDKCKPKNSKLSGIYTWKINSKIFLISLWKNGKVSLGTSTWSSLGQTNSWVMREDSCTFGKYHVNYTPETSVIKFLSHNSSTKTGLWQAEDFLAFLKNSSGLGFFLSCALDLNLTFIGLL